MTAAATATTREVDGRTLPVPGTWAIDPGHSMLSFECAHMDLARLRGWFTGFEGAFEIAEQPEDSSVHVSIDASTLQMPNPDAVARLVAENFLDVENHPTIEFASTGVRHMEGDRWQVAGDLTILGTTAPVELDATLGGVASLPEPFGGATKMGFTATTSFDRRDFGLVWNVPLAGGRLLVGNLVALVLDVEAVLQ